MSTIRKADVTAMAAPKCLKLAERLGFELVDVALEQESAGSYLRIYIDKPTGITLDDCETYHRAIQPQLEAIDYDFLEVSSPGVDRPLKKDRDFERAAGDEVEVHLFRPMDGVKRLTGTLAGLEGNDIVLVMADGSQKRIPRKAASLVKAIVDMEGVDEVDLSDPADGPSDQIQGGTP